ncbi:MAG: hypothetical protein IPJ65_07275 [Archangiaceae bacterium]|nr:hypothetical protein [Archangiaceae bacterium]
MPKYVLKRGSISRKSEFGATELVSSSADPSRPTVVELDEVEAYKMGGDGALQLLTDYEAERNGATPPPPGPLGAAQHSSDRARAHSGVGLGSAIRSVPSSARTRQHHHDPKK